VFYVKLYVHSLVDELKKTPCFGLWRPSSGFDNFIAIRVTYNKHKPCGNVENSSSLSFACVC